MIPVPSGVRVWVATGATDLRKGMNGLALLPSLTSIKKLGAVVQPPWTNLTSPASISAVVKPPVGADTQF